MKRPNNKFFMIMATPTGAEAVLSMADIVAACLVDIVGTTISTTPIIMLTSVILTLSSRHQTTRLRTKPQSSKATS